MIMAGERIIYVAENLTRDQRSPCRLRGRRDLWFYLWHFFQTRRTASSPRNQRKKKPHAVMMLSRDLFTFANARSSKNPWLDPLPELAISVVTQALCGLHLLAPPIMLSTLVKEIAAHPWTFSSSTTFQLFHVVFQQLFNIWGVDVSWLNHPFIYMFLPGWWMINMMHFFRIILIEYYRVTGSDYKLNF